MKFYDNEIEIAGEAEQLEEFSLKHMRDFKGSAFDLLHDGNVDAVLLVDEQKGKDAYNDKMLKYNSKFAQLIGKQRNNVEMIEDFVNKLPHLEYIDEIRK